MNPTLWQTKNRGNLNPTPMSGGVGGVLGDPRRGQIDALGMPLEAYSQPSTFVIPRNPAPLSDQPIAGALGNLGGSEPRRVSTGGAQPVPPRRGTVAALKADIDALSDLGSDEHVALTNAVDAASSFVGARKALAKASMNGLKIALRTAPQKEAAIIQMALGWDNEGNQVADQRPTLDEIGQKFGYKADKNGRYAQGVKAVLNNYGVNDIVLNKMWNVGGEAVTLAELLPGQSADGAAGNTADAGFSIVTNPANSHVFEAPTSDMTDEERQIAQANLRDTAATDAYVAERGITPKELAQPSSFQTAKEVHGEEVAKANREAHAARERMLAARETEVLARPTRGGLLEYLRSTIPNLQPVDLDNAREEYDDDLLAGDAPFDALLAHYQAQWVRAYIAYLERRVSARDLNRIFQEVANENRTPTGAADSRPTGAGQEKDFVGQVQGRLPRQDAAGSGRHDNQSENRVNHAEGAPREKYSQGAEHNGSRTDIQRKIPPGGRTVGKEAPEYDPRFSRQEASGNNTASRSNENVGLESGRDSGGSSNRRDGDGLHADTPGTAGKTIDPIAPGDENKPRPDETRVRPEEITHAGIIDRWNEDADALGITPWEGLSDEQRSFISGSGSWAEYDEAAYDVLNELNDVAPEPPQGAVKYGEGQASTAPLTETDAQHHLVTAIDQWKRVVASFFDGTFNTTNGEILLDSAPASMQALGAPNLPVRLFRHALEHIDSRFSRAQYEAIPTELADPRLVVMLEDAKTGEPGLVYITRFGNASGLMTVAIHPNKNISRGGKANYLATVKPMALTELLKYIGHGRTMYVGDVSELAGVKQRIIEAQKKNGSAARKFRETLSQKAGLTTVPNRIIYKSDVVKLVQSGKAQYGEGQGAGTSANKLSNTLRKLFFSPAKFDQLVTIVQSTRDLDPQDRAKLSQADASNTVYGFTSGGRVVLIADNIPPGKELAVFLHEVGVHLGMENLIGKDNMERLSSQVEKWAASNDGSQVSGIAKKAVARANESSSSAEFLPEENIAYFVEEAVAAGIDPYAIERLRDGTLKNWFRSLWAAAKVALRKIGFMRFDQLTTQDLVNLAYGAAQRELQINERLIKPREDALQSWGKKRFKPNAEKGTGADAKEKDILRYYAKGGVEADAKIFYGLGVPGGENVFWGTDSTYGAYRGITTFAETDTVDGKKTLTVNLSSSDVLSREDAKAAINDGLFEKVAIQRCTAWEVKPNVWTFYIDGPIVGSPAYEVARKGGGVKKVAAPDPTDSLPYTHLENIPRGDYVEMLVELRRRITRMQAGVVPNVIAVRETGSNVGRRSAYTPEKVSVKFSQGTKVAQAIEKQFGDSGLQVWENATTLAQRAFRQFMSLHDVVKEYGGVLPSAKAWHDSVLAATATRRSLEADAESIAARAGKLKRERLDAVNDFVSRSTYEQKWGYAAAFDKADGSRRNVMADPEMAKAFRALRPEEQQIVKDIFAHGERMKAEKEAILKALDLDGEFNKAGALSGPYTPLKRFGDFIGVAKSKELVGAETAEDTKLVEKLKADPNHYLVSYFDTKGQAAQFARESARAGWHFTQDFAKSVRINEGHPMKDATLNKVLSAIKAEKLPPGALNVVTETVKALYFSALDEHNARTSGLKRKNRAGYDADMVRSFLSHAQAEAGFLANIKHGGATNDLFYRLQSEAAKHKDRAKAQEVFNTLASHYAANLDQKATPIQDRVMALTSIQQLATNPAYHLQNLMQPSMVTVPRLAADFGDYAGAWRHLLNGYKVAGLTGVRNIDLSKVKNLNLRAMLTAAEQAGLLDVGMDEDLNQFTRTRSGFEAVDNASGGLQKLVHKLRQVSRMVEATNRISAGAAAYSMALEKGQSAKDATEYALSVLRDTQGDFSRTDAPLILKNLPKVVGQYRKFQLMMAAHYVKAFRDAFLHEDANTNAVGRRALIFSLGHAFMTAGVLGIPLVNVVALLFSAMGGEDEPKDLERWMRESLGSGLAADMLTHGPLMFAGMDAKLAQDKVFSFLPYAEWDLTSRKGVVNLVTGAMGPSMSNAAKMADGLGLVGKGEYHKGLEKLLPSGLANGMKAYRIANEGYTLPNGDVMVTPDDISGFLMAMDAVGLKGVEMRTMDWTRSQQYEIKQFYTTRTKEIQQQYAAAVKESDKKGMQQALENWQALQTGKDNLRRYFNGSMEELKVQPLSNLLRYPQMQAQREHKLQNGFTAER